MYVCVRVYVCVCVRVAPVGRSRALASSGRKLKRVLSQVISALLLRIALLSPRRVVSLHRFHIIGSPENAERARSRVYAELTAKK